ncbi:hypothetical protein C8T65DRAFT_645023 [Cerioporus squamosus]|nr:hypothetical protein C8T65DRAFT_645023 [Cerioporus squamosus]
MCFDIVPYVEWACGFRRDTGRQHVDCRRTFCRLSDMHRTEEHDCDTTCMGVATGVHHIVTDTYRTVCEQCTEARREEHPGMRRDQDGGASGGIQYQYLTRN